MKKWSLMILLPLLLPVFVFGAGGITSVFDIGVSVKAQSMGGAYLTGTNDSSSVYYNPSLLYTMDYCEVQGAYIPLYFDTIYNYVTVGIPTMNFGAIGLSFAMFSTGNIIFRDGDGVETTNTSQLLTETTAGWGIGILEDLINVGFNLKLDYQSIDTYDDFSFAMDVGASYNVMQDKINSLDTALVVKNAVEPQVKLDSDSDNLPRHVIAGAGYKRVFTEGFDAIARIEMNIPFGIDFGYKVGIEMNIIDMISLRGGYNSDEMISAGLGIKILDMYNIDYALIINELDMNHRVSIGAKFGESIIAMRGNREEIENKKIAKKAREMAGKELKKLRTKMTSIKRDAAKKEYFKAFHYTKGLEAYYAGDLKSALVEFETVLQVDAGYINTRYYASLIGSLVKRSKQETYSEEILVIYRAGVEKYLREDYVGARDEWQKILKIDKYNRLAIENLKEVKSLLRDIEEIGE